MKLKNQPGVSISLVKQTVKHYTYLQRSLIDDICKSDNKPVILSAREGSFQSVKKILRFAQNDIVVENSFIKGEN